MNYAEEREHQLAAVQQQEQSAREAEAVYVFFKRHVKEVVACEASRQACIRYFNGDEITLEALEDSWLNHPAFRASLATQTEPESRERLVAEITKLLQGGGSPSAVNGEIVKIPFRATEELLEWRDRLASRKAAREKSPQELRAILKESNVTAPEELPSHISRNQILHMLSGPELRALINRYGSAAVTKRVNERK
jgi:hypothetical protein